MYCLAVNAPAPYNVQPNVCLFSNNWTVNIPEDENIGSWMYTVDPLLVSFSISDGETFSECFCLSPV